MRGMFTGLLNGLGFGRPTHTARHSRATLIPTAVGRGRTRAKYPGRSRGVPTRVQLGGRIATAPVRKPNWWALEAPRVRRGIGYR